MEFPALIVVHQLETTVTKSIGSALCFELTWLQHGEMAGGFP